MRPGGRTQGPGGQESDRFMKKRASHSKRTFRWLLGAGLVGGGVLVGMIFALNTWPVLGAQGADLLRAVFGDKVVATLEAGVYRVQDTFQHWSYDLGWTAPIFPAGAPSLVAIAPTAASLSMTPASASSSPGLTAIAKSPATLTPNPPVPATPTNSPWHPGPLVPLGALRGAGGWAPYIQDAAGRTVAFLTSFQPDPGRAYAVAAVVAFDLHHTRLHFVLGTIEPYAPDSPPRSGAIPKADRSPGVLLAMFNGGFKSRHGQFGAMADGVVALPARDGLGTLAIDREGGLHIGAWGQDILPSPDWVAWRQNGPLVIHQGAINPRVYNDSPSDWGYTVGGASPTWRSGIGLSADGMTLYYVCGPSLTIEALANSLLASGSAEAIQLDINNYWVHFVAVRTDGKNLILEPLFPGQMKENIDRYLWNYTRDYFYVTG